MTKLNLGCGRKHKNGYINIDIQEPCDLKHDLRNPLPFENESIDGIYSRDVIELLSRRQWEELKREMTRVLKPGGEIEIFCGDFEYAITNFLACKDERKKWEYWLMWIFSGQGDEFDYCKNAFTYDKLVSDLKEEGMGEFVRSLTQEDIGWIHLNCSKKL